MIIDPVISVVSPNEERIILNIFGHSILAFEKYMFKIFKKSRFDSLNTFRK